MPRALLRMRPRSSGDMSCCLCSCLISSLLIFSDFSWLWRDQPTSAIAITTSTPRTRQARSSTSPPMNPASWLGCSAPHRCEIVATRPDRQEHDAGDDRELGDALDELDQAVRREDAACARLRADPLEVRLQVLQDELRAHLRDRGGAVPACNGKHERQRDDQKRLHEQVQCVVEAAVRQVGRGHRLEGVAHRRLQVPEHRGRAHCGEVGERGAENEQGFRAPGNAQPDPSCGPRPAASRSASRCVRRLPSVRGKQTRPRADAEVSAAVPWPRGQRFGPPSPRPSALFIGSPYLLLKRSLERMKCVGAPGAATGRSRRSRARPTGGRR